jgi:hypothetical protein
VNALENDIEFAANSAAASQLTTGATLDATPADTDPMKVQKRYLSRAKQIQTVAKERLDVAKAAATVFGVSDRIVGRARAESIVDSVATSMATRAKLFADAVVAARAAATTAGDGAAMAAAADAGEMPVGVLADYLQENGKDAQAETLRAAFGVNGPAPEVADDGTFRLVTDDADTNTDAAA